MFIARNYRAAVGNSVPAPAARCGSSPIHNVGQGGQTGSLAAESGNQAEDIRGKQRLLPQSLVPAPQSPSSISRLPIDFDKCKNRFTFQMLQTGKCGEGRRGQSAAGCVWPGGRHRPQTVEAASCRFGHVETACPSAIYFAMVLAMRGASRAMRTGDAAGCRIDRERPLA
jgi:hypothetical protein